MLIKVKDEPGLYKDSSTGAIINNNKKKAEEYLAQKALRNANKIDQKELSSMKEKLSEIDNIKKDLDDIKSLLKELLSK